MADRATPDVANKLAGNVGWQSWNYSKRASSALSAVRIAREHLNSARGSDYWRPEELDELERIVALLDECARRAEQTWATLRAEQDKRDHERVTDGEGIAVIHSGGTPELLERLSGIFHAGRVTEYSDLMDECKALVVEVERRRCQELQSVIDAAVTQRRRTDYLHWHELYLDDDALEKSMREYAARYEFSDEAKSELRQLTVRLEDCADRARTVQARLLAFANDIAPESSLWGVDSTLEAQIFVIRGHDTTLSQSKELENRIEALYGEARTPAFLNGSDRSTD